MFWNLVVAEQSKIFKRKLFWVELAGLLVLMLIQIVSRYQMAASGPSAQVAQLVPGAQQTAVLNSTWPRAFAVILTDLSSTAWLAVIVLAGALVAQEYTWHSLQLWLSHGVPRRLLVLSKAVALVAPVALLVALPLLVGSALAAASSLLLTGGLSVTVADLARLGLGFGAIVYALLPYLGLALLLAIAGRSLIAPLGAGIALALVEFVLFISGNHLAAYLPRGLAASLERFVQGLYVAAVPALDAARLTPQPAMLEPTLAVLVVAIWIVISLGLAMGVLRRQDLTE